MLRRYNLIRSDNFPTTGAAVLLSDSIVLEDEDLSITFSPTVPALVTRINLNFSRGNFLTDIIANAYVKGANPFPATLLNEVSFPDKEAWILSPQTPLHLLPGDYVEIFAAIAEITKSSSSISSSSSSSKSSSSSHSTEVSSQSGSSSSNSSSSGSSFTNSFSTQSSSTQSSPSESSQSGSSLSSDLSSSSTRSSSSLNSSSSSSSSENTSSSSSQSSVKTSISTESSSSSLSSSLNSSSTLFKSTSSISSTGQFRVTYEIHYIPLYQLSSNETAGTSTLT